jgi:hypothetical protein
MLRAIRFAVIGLASLGAANAAGIYTPTPVNPTTTYGASSSCSGVSCTQSLTFATGSYYNTVFSSTYKNGFQPTLQSTAQNVNTQSGSIPVVVNNESNGNGDWVSAAGTNKTSELVLDLGSYTGTVGSTMTNQGVFSVDKIWTMLQANGEVAGSSISITLNGLNSLGAAVSDTIVLTAGTDYRGTSNTASVVSDAAGTGNTQATAAGSLSNGNQVYVSNNAFGTLGPDTGSAYYYLDVQEIDLTSAFIGGYLDQVIISAYNSATQRIIRHQYSRHPNLPLSRLWDLG